MERRLLKVIMNPAMAVTWVLGLWLGWKGGWFGAGWLQVKILLVLVLSGLHGFLARWVRDFDHDHNRHPARFYRIINEVPTALMIGIVVLAVVKPF
jgi:putative membrane protein